MNMILAKAPEKYWNEPGILAKGGEVVASIGKRAWIFGRKDSVVRRRRDVIEKPRRKRDCVRDSGV